MSALPNPSFWRNRCVLVTGHTGFKGAWLSLWLSRLGANVHGLALAPEAGSLFAEAGLERCLASCRVGDVRDAATVRRCVEGVRPQVVVHLAGVSLVADAEADPVRAMETNCGGTANLLAALEVCPSTEAAVIVTTDKVYRGEAPDRGFRESDPLGPVGAYGASKAAAEAVVAAWAARQARRCAVATARAGNCIGGGDIAAGRLVPDVIRSSRGQRALRLRRPGAIRPWQHVLDPLAGYLVLAEALATHSLDPEVRALNFGPGRGGEATVLEVVEALAAAGLAPPVEIAPIPDLPEENVLRLDASLASRTIGWQPRWSFTESIVRTAEFHAGGARSLEAMNADLEAYCL